ncbi:MAG: DUF1549 and DUF1553 domain-containing protein [Gemmataceae bacterium]|nr:DUF1549 and DUF1553 domain-containing protein [Gemmataceae bacterium]
MLTAARHPGRLPWLVVVALAFAPASLRAQEKPLRELIDQEIRAAWAAQKVTPASRADDPTFQRRLHLDLVGTIPTHDEVKAFLQDPDPGKRAKLIDRLLDDPRFAAHQAGTWDLVLFGRNPPNPEATRRRDPFRGWLREQFAKNVPYDRWVRELLKAEGDTAQQGAPLFYVQFRGQPEETAVGVSRIFLGTQLQCARCHDHPNEKWTQRDFFGLAAFFARLVVVDAGTFKGGRKYIVGEKRTGEVHFSGPAAEQKPGKKGEPIGAKFLGGPALTEPPLPANFKETPLKGAKVPPRPDFSRKEKLAEWLTTRDNPYFARAVADRLWGQFLRRGLVHPVDNLSAKNTASHPKLLDTLTEQLVEHDFDLKWFIRELVSSETYQLASRGKTADPVWFEQARLRPLSAEEMMATLRAATGFDASNRAAGVKPGQEKLPSGLAEYVVRHFGNSTDGRGDFQGNMTERLFVNNNSALRQLIQRRKGNLADALLTSKDPWEQRVERMFLSVLSRPPQPEETRRFAAYLSRQGSPDALVEEAIWVLLASAEFRFNH